MGLRGDEACGPFTRGESTGFGSEDMDLANDEIATRFTDAVLGKVVSKSVHREKNIRTCLRAFGPIGRDFLARIEASLKAPVPHVPFPVVVNQDLFTPEYSLPALQLETPLGDFGLPPPILVPPKRARTEPETPLFQDPMSPALEQAPVYDASDVDLDALFQSSQDSTVSNDSFTARLFAMAAQVPDLVGAAPGVFPPLQGPPSPGVQRESSTWGTLMTERERVEEIISEAMSEDGLRRKLDQRAHVLASEQFEAFTVPWTESVAQYHGKWDAWAIRKFNNVLP